MENKEQILSVKNLKVSFKADSGIVHAVRGVSFDLYKGETLCIVGESGSGKSVTNKAIMGILSNNAIIEGGQILYEGEDLVRVSEEEFHRIRGHKIGMIFQDPLSSLNPIMKVGKQITEATLINRNILKRTYNEYFLKELVQYRNSLANKNYEHSIYNSYIDDINKLIKRNNNKKISEEEKAKLDTEIKEFISTQNRLIHDSANNYAKSKEKYGSELAELKDETYFKREILVEKDKLIDKKIELVNNFLSKFNVENEDKIALLNEIKEFYKGKKVFSKLNFTSLKPLYKKALAQSKKDAKVKVKAYAAELEKDYQDKKSVLDNQIKDIDDKINLVLASAGAEVLEGYKKMLEDEKKAAKLAKKVRKNQEINLSKLTKKAEEIEETSGNQDLDNLHEAKKEVQAKIDELTREYINKTKITKAEAKRMALEVMREVGIPLPERRFNQYPFEFSGGMRQRIVIAIALTANPDILICDEPTTALDVTIQAQILELINKLKRTRNLSCIFITHDLGVVANMADRVAVMYAGKIVEYGTANEVFFDPRHPYTWALLSSIPDVDSKEKLEAIPGTPPDMRYPPKGDAFALRSKYAMAIDFKYEPPFFKVSDTHYAATWLLYPGAPKVEMPKIVKTRIENSLRGQSEELLKELHKSEKNREEA